MDKIIINADDFGRSAEINSAIISAMDSNLCMDATLLVNSEESPDAASLAIRSNYKKNIGIHLNLTEGYPLSRSIRKEKLFCNLEGNFHYKKKERIIFLSKSEKKAVYEELKLQVQFCRKLGIPISHADSHNHIHEEPGILPIIIHVLQQENIPFLRILRNIGHTSLINKMYRNTFNSFLSFYKLAGSNYFGSTADFYNSESSIKTCSITELMVHPGVINNNHILDIYSQENLSLQLPKILNGKLLSSYSQLR